MAGSYPKYIIGELCTDGYHDILSIIRHLKTIGYTTPTEIPIDNNRVMFIIDILKSNVDILVYENGISVLANLINAGEDPIYCNDLHDNYFIAIARMLFVNITRCGKDMYTYWIDNKTGKFYFCTDKRMYNKKYYHPATINEIIEKMKYEEDMCPYCKGKCIDSEYIDIRIDSNNKTMTIDYDAYSCDSSFNIDVKINYCPMCGRKL